MHLLMKFILSIITVYLSVQTILAAEAPQAGPSSQANLATMPVAFTENKGQWPDSILFRADAGGAVVWITRTGVYYQLFRRIEKAGEEDPTMNSGPLKPGKFGHERDSIETMLVKAAFVGSNPEPEVVAEGLMEYKCNYFIGNDPAKWATDVESYGRVILRGVYQGVDVLFEGPGGGRISYRYEFGPEADVKQIEVAYQGTEGTSIDEQGRVVATTKFGPILGLLTAPDGSEHALSEMVLDADLPVKGSRDSERAPQAVELVYSTYIGGNDIDEGAGIAVDDAGSAYVTGHTVSNDFPMQDPYQNYQTSYDVFISKLSASGTSLIYSTYLGGNFRDISNDIAVDIEGNAYVTGYTESTNFPSVDQILTDQEYDDVFISKLSASGTSLIYSTYLGGNSHDYGTSIAVDEAGNAYVTGETGSLDFPTLDSYQTDQEYSDVFVTKLSSTGKALVFSTYLGGNGSESGDGIAVDGAGNVYVTGFTYSTNFPTQHPHQSYQSNSDVFITKLSSTGADLVYSTYLGGGGWDNGYEVAVDEAGNAYVTGATSSLDFPTLGPYQTDHEYSDVFVTKLSASGTSLIYSTYLGGNSYDHGTSIAVNGSGCAYVTGATQSTDFPTQNAYDGNPGGVVDAFVSKLSAEGGIAPFCDSFTGLFCDDFEGGADAAWQATEGTCNWEAINGTYHAALSGAQLSCVRSVGDGTWRNYVFEVRVRGNAGVDKIVRFRETDSETRYFVNLRSDWLGADELLLGKQVGGEETILATAEHPSENGVWYSLRITCVDERISVSVDGTEVIAYDDYESRIYSGGIGLVCFTGEVGICDISFDDVRVTDPFPHLAFDEVVIGEIVGDQVTISGYLSHFDGSAYIPDGGVLVVEDPARDTVAECDVQPDGRFLYMASTAGSMEGLHLYVFACSTASGWVREAYGVALRDTMNLDEKAGGEREKVWWLSRKISMTAKTVKKDLPKPTDFMAFRAINSAYQASGQVLEDGLVAMFGAMKADITVGWKRTFDGGNPVVEGSKIQLQKCNVSQPWTLGSCVLGVGGLTWTGLSVPWNTMLAKIDGGLDLARQANLINNCTYQGAKSGVEVGDMLVGIFGVRRNKPQSWKKFVEEGFGFQATRQLVENRFNDCLGGAPNPFPSLGVTFDMHGFDAVLMGLYPKIDMAMVIRGHSPIDITVTDPLGRVLSPTVNEIPGGDYYVFDSDLDGDSEQVVIVPLDSLLGDVTVEVAPQAGADPNEIVSVVAEYTYYQEPLVLVDSLPLSMVPATYEPLPTFENAAPEAFDLLTMADTTFLGFPASLQWQRAVDPNPGHLVSFRVVIATDPGFTDSAVVEVGADTAYSFGGGLWKSTVDTATYYWRVYAHDDWNATVASTDTRSFRVEWKCGDINADRSINVADLTFLVNYLFKGGLKPPVEQAADVNGSSGINVSDLTYMVNYLFRGGPAPVACP